MWISLYLGPQCFCCTILRDVIFVEACSASVMSTTCILQHAVVCWVTAAGRPTTAAGPSQQPSPPAYPSSSHWNKLAGTSSRGCPWGAMNLHVRQCIVAAWWPSLAAGDAAPARRSEGLRSGELRRPGLILLLRQGPWPNPGELGCRRFAISGRCARFALISVLCVDGWG
jgi:hypothetical protein